MIPRNVLKAYRWFRENGAACLVGRCAENALRLARAEAWAEEQAVTFVWEYETDFAPDDMPEPEECEYLMAAAVLDGTSLAALGGIQIYPNDRAYRRLVEADLAVEAHALWVLRQEAAARAAALVEAGAFEHLVTAFLRDGEVLAPGRDPRDGQAKAELIDAYVAAFRTWLQQAAGWSGARVRAELGARTS